ncbi:MAG: NADH dehydrogenase [ubiquinone] 1 alpha subcomplex assembly factor 1 [Cyclobacteriaceae bacterium]|jgi:hypothetical protein
MILQYLLFLILTLLSPNEPVIIDFSLPKEANKWVVVNDGVMGGLSKGKLTLTKQGVKFYGTVSLENNGGFTSLRSPYSRLDLSQFQKFSIKYKSEGVLHAFQLEHHDRFYLPNHKLPLKNSEEWTIIEYDLRDLDQYQMGRKTNQKMSDEALSKNIRLGFITSEKRAGSFTLEIAEIRFY